MARRKIRTDDVLTTGPFYATGDSLVAAGATANAAGGSTGNTTNYHQRGFVNWLQAKYNYPVFHEFRNANGSNPFDLCNKGVSGDETYQLMQRIRNDLVIQRPGIVLLQIGTNDIASGRAASNIINNYRYIVETLMTAGHQVWAMTVFPRNNEVWTGFTAEKEAVRQVVNAWIRGLTQTYNGRVLCLDCDPVLGGAVLSPEYTYDGTHLNSAGAMVICDNVLWPQMRRYVTQAPRYIPENHNLTALIYGNLLANSSFTISGGTVGTGATGECPSSWSVSRVGGSSTSIVSSISDNQNWNGDTVKSVTLDISCDGTGSDNGVARFGNHTAITSNINIGDTIVFEVEIVVSGVTGDNILRSIYLDGRDNGTGGECVRFFGPRFTLAAYKDFFPAGEHRIILRTHPIKMTTTSGILMRIEANVDESLIGSRRVTVMQPVARKVPFRFEGISP